ncbi:alpha/beta hydrolase [Rhodococcus triatomae]|uniref:Lysophospholipase, alpha-beta hydrolase superfamily n=1 Tax=Rhodococcus triatomae TaxID=300028 RepID=A0A1G8K361_9NOCA|nr:alpha/beta fold hydrolase [Rhodococcus triatomae]QNG18811.1 alpha/beta hydrolase [Rhodococcus triatomae]QNG25278.1 alpha/beta hydrolase [Rhodococcus triatomae]SDI37885.1 Lysophospholipase, alpha-beta hydrolase superfamily [Rhodococcus triatomae]
MFTYTSDDGIVIHVHEWLTDGRARGIVQLAHGMGEHAARYAPIAESLNAEGFHVYAADHRGHGTSMHAEPGAIGKDGWNHLVQDMVALTGILRERHPGLPVVLLAHSLGSFATQQYLLDHSDLVDAVALSGTTAVDQLIDSLVNDGPDVLAQFNAEFEPARTGYDWLSRDEHQVDLYLSDPLCGFSLDASGMGDLIAAGTRFADVSTVRKNLPVYVFVGDRDPLNAKLTRSDLLVDRYRAAGITDVTYQVYPGARHEILNETNRAEVLEDLTGWLDRVITAG